MKMTVAQILTKCQKNNRDCSFSSQNLGVDDNEIGKGGKNECSLFFVFFFNK
jgi:hypothetical protein